MTRPSKRLRPERVQLAAAFSEPAYERLRLVDEGRIRHLLAFVHPVPQRIMKYLESEGAAPCRDFRANCYAAIWELPETWSTKSNSDFLSLDLAIAAELRTFNGKYPAEAGYWTLGHPRSDAPGQMTSNLLAHSRSDFRSR